MNTATPGFSFGMRMGCVREDNEMTKAAMARSLSISPSTWLSYENDNTFPTEKTIELFCKLYHVNRDWLFSNEGPIYMPHQNN